MWPSRLSFSQVTAGNTPLDELIDAAVAACVPRLGLQRRRVEEFGAARAVELVRNDGIRITSYGGAGYWAAGVAPDGTLQTLSDNLRCLDQAADLGTSTVVIQLGGLATGERDLRAARARAADGLMDLIPHAVERNLQLAMEVAHPIFCPDVSVLSTLRQAMDLIEQIGHPGLGVLVDTMHVWWDPDLVQQLRRAGEHVFLVQLNDWLLPPGNRYDRGLMGDGCIDFDVLLEGLGSYSGWFEVEASSDALRSMNLPALFERAALSFEHSVGRHLAAQPTV